MDFNTRRVLSHQHPDSPLEKLTPSNQFNLLASDCLDKAVAVPKVAALNRRFHTSLNYYLEAPIMEHMVSKATTNKRIKESLNQTTDMGGLRAKRKKTKRPQSSLELLTLTTKFNKNFVRSENMTKKIKTGVITKPMLAPIPYKFGQSFKNKSEEERYSKNCTELFKLRTLLVNDPSHARETLMNVSPSLTRSSSFAS